MLQSRFGVSSLQAGDVARVMALHPRTLQRRLADENTSFQDQLALARRNFAERSLADGELSISDIAYILGFAEPSAFHRAFRRWTGRTPAAIRARPTGPANS